MGTGLPSCACLVTALRAAATVPPMRLKKVGAGWKRVVGKRSVRRRKGRPEGGSNSVVESQPSKLLVAGSIPVSRSSLRLLRELRLGKPETGEGCLDDAPQARRRTIAGRAKVEAVR